MKKKIQKYLSGEREGFSLVELIIVIAIMAILIGVVALAVIPYLEQSRVSKDKQTIDTVYGAFQSAIANQQVTSDVTVEIIRTGDTGNTAKVTITGGTDAQNDAFAFFMAEALNATKGSNATTTLPNISKGTADKLESANAKKGTIKCVFNKEKGEISVWATGTTVEGATRSDVIYSSNKSTPEKIDSFPSA